MAKNSHEQLADSIVKDIMEARNEEEYDKIVLSRQSHVGHKGDSDE